MSCRYCDLIVEADSSHIRRDAEFDLGSHAPRCAWHWRVRTVANHVLKFEKAGLSKSPWLSRMCRTSTWGTLTG